MLKTRLNEILLPFCILIFFIFAPVLLFYALGYKYDPGGGKIIKTGGLFMSFWPDSADIYLDGNLKQKRYQISISGGLRQIFQEESLLPGNHKIKIVQNGYYDWEKEIRIEESRVYLIENILLVPQKSAGKKLTGFKNSLIKNLFLSPSGKKIIFSSYDKINSPNIPALWIFDAKTEKAEMLADSAGLKKLLNLKNNDNELNINGINWSPNESLILADLSSAADKTLIINIAKKQTGVFKKDSADEKKIDRRISNPVWPDNENKLLFVENNGLYVKEINNPKEAPALLMAGVSAFALKENMIYFVGKNALYKISLADLLNKKPKVARLSGDSPPQINLLNSIGENSKIIISGNNDLFILDQKKSLYYFDAAKILKKISGETMEMKLSPDNEIFAYSAPFEIWAYYLKNNGIIKKNKYQKEMISRYGNNISAFEWLADSGHLIFLIEGKIKITEIDDRDYRQTLNIVEQEKISEFVYQREKGEIYYIAGENENQNLYSSGLNSK